MSLFLLNSKNIKKYIFDCVPGAVATFLYKKLKKNCTEPCIRVRRSSDNLEKDITFSGDYLDIASLLSFVGSGDGFLVKSYNQMGLNNIFASSTASGQPIIVSSGNLVSMNSRFAVLNDGIDDNLTCSTLTNSNFPQSEFTIIIKNAVASGVTDQGIFNAYASTSNSPFIKYSSSMSINYALGYNGGQYNSYTSPANSIVANTLNIFAMSVKTGTAGRVKYYLNGAKVYDQAIANTSWLPNAAACAIQKAIGGNIHKWDAGCIIFNRQLSDNEINLVSNAL